MSSILVIDASRTIRETLSIVLGQEFHVSTAASAAEPSASAESALVILGLSARADEEPMRALLAARPDVPVLVLHGSEGFDPGRLALAERRVGFLRKPFDGHALQAAVRALLATPTRPDARASARTFVLDHPYLTREAAATVRESVPLDLPLLFVGERGTGALQVARALHARSRPRARFDALPARDVQPGDLRARLDAPDDGLFLDDVAGLPLETQHALLIELEHGAARGRLFAATAEPLDAAVAGGAFLSELAYPLGVLTVPLPPLRDRIEDLPRVVETVSAALAARLGLAPVLFSDAAVDRLCHYLWFGNLTELEAVLARTMAGCSARVIDADDLRFLPASMSTARPVAIADAARIDAQPERGREAARLEVLLGELAHELRNPMVTIKTLSQRLGSILDDPDERARFKTLTDDAVERMDTLLEQLLEFARFRAPARAEVDLGPLVDEALAEHRDELTRRGVRIERNGAVPGPVDADRAQVLFAVRSLLGGLVHELIPHEPLKMTVPESGAFELEARAEPATVARLTAFVEGADTESAETPTLPFALAAALLERNGGSLRVRSGPDKATIVRVALAPVAT